MLMPDPPAALAESRRVLRPGGKLALAVMAGPAENPWASSVAMSIAGLGLIPPIDPKASGGVFSMSDQDDLRQMLARVGFDDVAIEEVEFHLRFADFEDFWNFVREFAGAVAILLQSFSDEERDAIREATERATEQFRTEQGYDIPGLSVNAVAL
jgi:hypothetical protein